jgi:predicted MPP superfamily phosphohydrolase
MRRQSLPPPGNRNRLLHNPLPDPAHAVRKARFLFNPVTGWFRSLERWVNHGLSRQIYPRMNGLHRIYDTILKKGLTVSEGETGIRGLGPGLHGLRVLLISDVHCGPFISPERLTATFRRTMALEPDLIVLAGDLATSRVEEFTRCLPAFRELKADLGVYAVLGNHDHYTGEPDRLRREMEGAGIGVLQNRHAIVQKGGDRLVLAGIDDLAFGRPDLDQALAGRPGGLPVVLVSHNPDVFFDAARADVDLVLSGHTHGGQIRCPGLPVLVRMSRFRLDEGRYEAAGSELVVSRGLGAVGLPFRFACPPEVVLLILRSVDD